MSMSNVPYRPDIKMCYIMYLLSQLYWIYSLPDMLSCWGLWNWLSKFGVVRNGMSKSSFEIGISYEFNLFRGTVWNRFGSKGHLRQTSKANRLIIEFRWFIQSMYRNMNYTIRFSTIIVCNLWMRKTFILQMSMV